MGGNSAATLVKQGRRLEWEVLVDEDDHDSGAVRTQSIQVYPKTSIEGPPPPKITAYQRAEQSARFLRDFYPDLDIPFDVLQELVMEDHSGSEKANVFDPYAGNRLVAITVDSPFGDENSLSSPISFLAFVSGEGESSLNISAFGQYNGKFAPLVACPNILKDFERPILQLIGLPTSNGVCALAVRMPNAVVVCQLVPKKGVKKNQPPVTLKVLGSVELSHPDSGPVMDMIFDHVTGETLTPVRLILVDESGRLWRWSPEATSPVLLLNLPIENTRKYALSSEARHWRLAHSGLAGVVYILSGRFIGRVDLTGDLPSCEIVFELHPNDGIFTSITSTAIEFTLCAATTTKLLWLDTPSGKTVAAWRHDRQSEPGLQVVWMPGVTHLEKDESFDVFELTSEQAIFRTRVDDTGSSYPDDALRVWSKEVYGMEAAIEEAERNGSKYGRLGLRESQVYDLRSLYKRLFFGTPKQDAESGEQPTVDPEELLQNMRATSMDSAVGGSSLLTFHDIARQVGSERADDRQRSSLFASTAFHSEDGYDALQEACDTAAIPPIEAIAQNTAWSWNISDTLDVLCGESVPVPYKIRDLGPGRYRKFDVAEPEMEDKDPSILKREYTSARTLAVDLAMSLDVFSTRPFQRPESKPEESLMEVDVATSMMSKTSITTSDPPPLHFDFLQPELSGVSGCLKMEDIEDVSAGKRRKRRVSVAEESLDLGVRLLLSEWRVGEDPSGVPYNNPYNPAPGPPKKPEPQQSRPAAIAPGLRSTERLSLYTSAIHQPHGGSPDPASQPDLKGGRDWATQPDMFGNTLPPVPILPSTQPVSGTFGSRPVTGAAAKKKKSRMRGF
ncbi:hypothetical protein FS837_006972 [Tulasnella sp. UAMH 9824]|nr:hypothetical protein FS837_006972 [Tulasnella sp. UAMH 9824]